MVDPRGHSGPSREQGSGESSFPGAREKQDASKIHQLGFRGISEADEVFKLLGRRDRMPWSHDFFRSKLPSVHAKDLVLTPPAHMLLLGLLKDLVTFAVGKMPG